MRRLTRAEHRQLRLARSVTVATGVLFGLACVVYPPLLAGLAALLVYCAVLAALWTGSNRLLRQRPARPPVPEPMSNVRPGNAPAVPPF